MNRILRSLLIIFTLVATFGFSNRTQAQDIISEERAAPDVIELEAARDYNPTSLHYDGGFIEFEGVYEVSEYLDVREGNSGVGWASLIVGDTKYCYQGNADDRDSDNGGLFELVAQKASASSPCHDDNNLPEINMEVELRTGDLVELRVEGGGCSLAAGTCELTSASTELFHIY